MLELSNPIIPAIRKDEEFYTAVSSPASAIFLLKADVMTLKNLLACKQDKKIFVHIDMAEGVGKDRKGIELLKSFGVDGIITTKSHLVGCAKELGLYTVQRFFLIDSVSLNTALECVNNVKPDFVELMPGIIPKAVKNFVKLTDTLIISGGLIEDKSDVISVLSAGAYAVSTGKSELWDI